MITVTKIFNFAASHSIPGHKGKCKNLHGHTYKLEVTVGAEKRNKEEMVIDFGELSEIVNKEIINQYDHQHLNQFFSVPTAEIMVESIFCQLKYKLTDMDYKLLTVKLWETDTCYAEYREE